MNQSFFKIIKRIVAEQGESILSDPNQLKPFIKNYANAEPTEDRIAFGRAIENGFYMELKRAPAADRIRVKSTLVSRLQTITGYDTGRCSAAVNLLESVINNQQTTVQKIDKYSIGFNILSFFIPLAGLILFQKWKSKTPKKAKGCAIAAAAGLVFIIFIFIADRYLYFNYYDPELENPYGNIASNNITENVSNNDVIDIDINILLREMENNSARTDQAYRNKIIRTSGRISSIKDNPLSITVEGENWDWLYVYFNESERNKILNLQRGQIITFRGVFDSSWSFVFIRNSVLE